MAKSVQHVLKVVTPQINRLLNRHVAVLGPGREFVVKISVKQTRTVAVVTSDSLITDLSRDDWNRILSRKWVGTYQLALEAIRDNGNKPTLFEKIREKSPDFYPQYRERMNRMLKKSGLPFWIRNVGYGLRNVRLQVIRR